MKYLLICSLFFITHGDTLATNAQSTIVAKKFIMGDVTTTSISTGTGTPSAATLATTKCVDTMSKRTVHDSIVEMQSWATETFAHSITNTGTGAASMADGILNIPTPACWKQILTYSGTTNGSGNYTVIFDSAFSVAPNVQASIPNQSATNYFIRVSSVSTTGFTVNVYQRSAVTILGIEVLLAVTTNVSGASVDILVTQK